MNNRNSAKYIAKLGFEGTKNISRKAIIRYGSLSPMVHLKINGSFFDDPATILAPIILGILQPRLAIAGRSPICMLLPPRFLISTGNMVDME
jgi:hypothetical protein